MPYSSDHISIHASTRGATEKGELENILGVFQSTLPREERRLRGSVQHKTDFNFNPRFHERSDACGNLHTFRYNDFNPRFHERSDIKGIISMKQVYYFNPRFHERSDRYC